MSLPDPIALDEFLTILKKHGVKECCHDGNSYAFADVPAARQLARDPAKLLEIVAPPTPGVVEPQNIDLDDILFGAK